MYNDEIVERLKALVAELDMLADELHWREAGMPNLLDMEWSVRARNAGERRTAGPFHHSRPSSPRAGNEGGTRA